MSGRYTPGMQLGVGAVLLMQSLAGPNDMLSSGDRAPSSFREAPAQLVPVSEQASTNLPVPERIASRLTLTPAFNFHRFEGYFFAHGILQVYPSANISWLSDSYYFLGQLGSTLSGDGNGGSAPRFIAYHSVFSGIARHWQFAMHDLFVAFQPGLSLVQMRTGNQWGVNPSVAFTIGYHLYFYQWFHLFVHLKGIVGEHLFDAYWRFVEVRFSAGLGIHLEIRRRDKPLQSQVE